MSIYDLAIPHQYPKELWLIIAGYCEGTKKQNQLWDNERKINLSVVIWELKEIFESVNTFLRNDPANFVREHKEEKRSRNEVIFEQKQREMRMRIIFEQVKQLRVQNQAMIFRSYENIQGIERDQMTIAELEHELKSNQ